MVTAKWVRVWADVIAPPPGELDQLAKYERAKIVERSRRGKLRKAREGKVVAGHTPNYGFRFNEARDGYEIDEEKMAVVRRIFHMVAVEGVNTHGIARTLEREGVPNPGGGTYWYKHLIKRFILDDVYKPHSFEEISGLVASEVAARLNPRENSTVSGGSTAGARRRHSSPWPAPRGGSTRRGAASPTRTRKSG
jgi:hypothetical protein